MEKKSPAVVALGFFDGVHLGHQSLLLKAKEIAEEKDLKSFVYTFENHPLTKIFPRYSPKLLMNNKEKIKKIIDLGIDDVILEDFNEELMHLSPKEFILKLTDMFDLKDVVVGFNYSFGYKGEGKIKELKDLGDEFGFEVHIVDPFLVDKRRVSSSFIRELIELGRVDEVKNYLGKNYQISGTIKKGKHLGRKYQIPTANLSLNEPVLLPKSGVYFTKITIDGKTYDGLTNLGNNPTFIEHPYSIETYIYDFDGSATRF